MIVAVKSTQTMQRTSHHMAHQCSGTLSMHRRLCASLKLSKAGVALLDIDPEAEEGKLLRLFPPNFAKR